MARKVGLEPTSLPFRGNAKPPQLLAVNGRSEWDRTTDIALIERGLYQLSYGTIRKRKFARPVLRAPL